MKLSDDEFQAWWESLAEALQPLLTDLPTFTQTAAVHAIIKRTPEDFQVTEELAYAPCGEGPHLYLYVEKRGLNTADIVAVLKRAFAVKNADIGFAGNKDRHALTRQWFSIHLPRFPAEHVIEKILEEHLTGSNIEVLRVERHRNKIRRGHARFNHFKVVLHQTKADEIPILKQACAMIAEKGFPNYYG
ncbi:MAG: tRNA pseudouridine(13) synthase TruD, partial [Lentisphaerae bacterium]